MSKMLILCGIQASGKSTYAKKWVLEDPEHRVRFNNDDVRNMCGKYWVTTREPLIAHIKESFLNFAMSKGYDIVIDNMNLNPKETKYLETMADSMDYEVEYKYFFTPVEECIRRDSERSNPIGEKVIKDTYRKYRTKLGAQQNLEYWSKRIEQNPNLLDAAIIDLDKTVAYNVVERPFFGPGCAENIQYDKPDLQMIKLIRILHKSGVQIIFLTGRDTSVKNETEQWIKNNVLCSEYILLMREEGDYCSSDECKSKLYDKYIKDKYSVIVTIDDDNSEMWLDKGLLHLKTCGL